MKRKLSLFLLLLLILQSFSLSFAQDYEKDIEEILRWKRAGSSTLLSGKNLEQAGSTALDWYALILARSGIEEGGDYLSLLKENVGRRYESEGGLDASKATEWHRILLSASAFGENIRDFAGIDLLGDGVLHRPKSSPLEKQGLNGLIFGLISLDSAGYETGDGLSRGWIIQKILEGQQQDGGFSLSGSDSDIDITAMALQALAPYYNGSDLFEIAGEKRSVFEAVERGLDYLASRQNPEGDFNSWGSPNLESTAQVIIALCALDKDVEDPRFIKKKGLLDALRNYAMEDGGYIHSEIYDQENPGADPESSNSMASEQALLAYLSLYRKERRFRRLYDYRPEMNQELKEKIRILDERIEASKGSKDKEILEKLYKDYLSIDLEERSYVGKFHLLRTWREEAGLELKDNLLLDASKESLGEPFNLFTGEKLGKGLDFGENEKEELKRLAPEDDLFYVNLFSLRGRWLATGEKDPEIEGLFKENLSLYEDYRSKVEKIRKKIKSLYPLDQLSEKDHAVVKKLEEDINSLPESFRSRIEEAEDLERALAKTQSSKRSLWIYLLLTLVLVALLLVAIIVLRKRRTRKERQRQGYLDDAL